VRCAIFVDGQNLYFTQRMCLGWSVDLRKLIEYFENRGAKVTDCFYYTAYNPEAENQNSFLQMIANFGYAVITKPLKTIQTETGLKHKGDMAVEVVLDMFNLIETYDCVILLSGDSQFERPLKMLRARGKDFYVIAHEDTLSIELRNIAGDHYLDITAMEKYIRLQQRHAHPYVSQIAQA
jgi:uncharacterized LabA/DUF88 family protein